MSINDAAQPNATPSQPDQTDQDRTAGHDLDAPVGLTQAQLNAIIANEKQKVRLALQKEYGDLDTLRQAKAELDKLREAELSEVDKLKQAFEAKVAELKAAEEKAESERLNALRLRIGQKLGLVPEFSALLQGADEEALTTHAQQLIAAMPAPPTGVHIPNLNATAGGEQTGLRRGVKLTSEQEQAIINAQKIDPTFTRERYLAALEQFKEKD